MEFEEKDFEQARGYANTIKTISVDIMEIFDEIDNTMNSMYGSDWNSCGAENAKERYDAIRSNYQSFCDDIDAMNKHVVSVTAVNEAADMAASKAVSSI